MTLITFDRSLHPRPAYYFEVESTPCGKFVTAIFDRNLSSREWERAYLRVGRFGVAIRTSDAAMTAREPAPSSEKGEE